MSYARAVMKPDFDGSVSQYGESKCTSWKGVFLSGTTTRAQLLKVPQSLVYEGHSDSAVEREVLHEERL